MLEELAAHPPVIAARRAMIRVFRDYMEREDELTRALIRLAFSEPALQSSWAPVSEAYVQQLGGMLAEAVHRDPDDFEIKLTARTLFAAMWTAALHWHTNGYQDDIGELLDQALELLDAGLSV
jgi:hypothetical protein